MANCVRLLLAACVRRRQALVDSVWACACAAVGDSARVAGAASTTARKVGRMISEHGGRIVIRILLIFTKHL